MKIIKFLKSIKTIYIILGLLAVVLIVSALGSKTKEGMTSGDYTTLRNYRIQRDDILSDIDYFIKAQGDSSPWGSSDTFKTNLQNYVKTNTSFSVKKFFKKNDLNGDGVVVVSKSHGTFIRDNSGNNLDDDEKLYYYDLVAQDKNKDGTIVAFKNTDQGNFYEDNKDNSGNTITSQSLSNTPYILQSIDSNDIVTQTTVDAVKLLLDNQIKLLNSADKNTINKSISSLTDVIDKIVALTNTNGGGGTNADLYAYNPNGIYTTQERHYYRDEETEPDTEQEPETEPKEYDDYNTAYSHERRRQNTSINDNSSSNYWKNLYLNSLSTMSGQQTPVYGSLLNGSNGPYDARDASSGTGTGNGITDTSNYDISTPPVQSNTDSRSGSSTTGSATSTTGSAAGAAGAAGAGTGTTGAATTSDAYLLNNSQNSQQANCPVGGCVTAGSLPNNFRPSPVPPCPPCERCPEPKFDCKRVPKYNSANNQYLPKPILSDFSQFGM